MAVNLWMVVCGGGKSMPGHEWSWVVAVKVWMVVGVSKFNNVYILFIQSQMFNIFKSYIIDVFICFF